MTPTLQQFSRELAALGQDTSLWFFEAGPPPCLACPAEHPDVGPLQVYDDGDELTICLGEKHHSHIESCNYLQHPESERMGLVASEAARFIDDVLADRVLFTIDFVGRECRGSSHRYLDDDCEGVESQRISIGFRGGQIRTERYVWTGPYLTKD